MNASDMGKKGAKKRWHGTTKKQRSEEMRRVALVRWAARAGRGAEKAGGAKKGEAQNDPRSGTGSAEKPRAGEGASAPSQFSASHV